MKKLNTKGLESNHCSKLISDGRIDLRCLKKLKYGFYT